MNITQSIERFKWRLSNGKFTPNEKDVDALTAIIENYNQSLSVEEEFNYKAMTVKLILSDLCEKLEHDTDVNDRYFTEMYAKHFLFEKIESKLRISISEHLRHLKTLIDINHLKTKINENKPIETPNKSDIESYFKQNINEIINTVKFYNAKN